MVLSLYLIKMEIFCSMFGSKDGVWCLWSVEHLLSETHMSSSLVFFLLPHCYISWLVSPRSPPLLLRYYFLALATSSSPRFPIRHHSRHRVHTCTILVRCSLVAAPHPELPSKLRSKSEPPLTRPRPSIHVVLWLSSPIKVLVDTKGKM
jgi:hypothetical protein